MDRYLVHPPVLTNDAGERRIYFAIRNSMFHTLTLKQREELPPDEITLLSLSLAATSFVLEFAVHDDVLFGQFAHLYIYHILHRHFSPKSLLYFGGFYPISASFQETANPRRSYWRIPSIPIFYSQSGRPSSELSTTTAQTRLVNAYRFYRSSESKAPTVKLLGRKASERSERDCDQAL
jgi:hypothetical protein